MPVLKRNGIVVDDSFAEAFGMKATGVIITAPTLKWARVAAQAMTGFATSVIACGCEAGIERTLSRRETPDARPGVRVLMFAMSTDELQRQMQNRVGQCVLTAAGSACFAGLDGEERLKVGALLRYFGDGHQIAKKIAGRRFWRVPVMDGEFVCEDSTAMTRAAVGGGNLLIMGKTPAGVLKATERAVTAIAGVPDVIMPFPGGIVRSGSKVGSKYKKLPASTNHAYCPTLRGAVDSALGSDISSVLEIVIDGLSADAVAAAMKAGIAAILKGGARDGVTRIGAGNYGGKLGKYLFHLKELLP
jgi:formylmethanofuran--tetrahydromethanopterin N-formyltransferase